MISDTKSRDFLVLQLRQLSAMQFLTTISEPNFADLPDSAESRYDRICEYIGKAAECITRSLFPDAEFDEYGLVQIGGTRFSLRFALLSQHWWEAVEFELGEKFGTLE